MKIAISTNSKDPDLNFSARFGRCKWFLVVDPTLGEWQVVENKAVDVQGGAGTLVVQLLADLGVEVVISGRYGPNAFDALEAAGIIAYLANSGTPRELAAAYQAGQLQIASGPNGSGHHGGKRRGLGRRRGNKPGQDDGGERREW
jgi:predicted Fe-Mo cluster-binding NifX family protein